MIESKGTGVNFVESKYLMIEKLNIVYDEGIVMDRPRDRNIKYDLKKGDVYVIDPDIRQIKVGLGWDPAGAGRSIDVDASVIIFNELEDNKKTYKGTQIVYFGRTMYKNAVIHSGDNLTGKGDGDDETITIKLNEMDDDKEADVLFVMINIYTCCVSFSNIKNCFARLIDDRGKELCKFNLTKGCNSQGMIMCHIEKRKNGCWGMTTDGVGCGGKTADGSGLWGLVEKNSVNGALSILKTKYGNGDGNYCTCCLL